MKYKSSGTSKNIFCLHHRKKYFVNNEDMDAIDKNPVLLTNIYHQV